TGPPSVTPAIQSGSWTEGTMNSTVPGNRAPNRICTTSRTAITKHPSFKNEPNDLAHGAAVRRGAAAHATTPRDVPGHERLRGGEPAGTGVHQPTFARDRHGWPLTPAPAAGTGRAHPHR